MSYYDYGFGGGLPSKLKRTPRRTTYTEEDYGGRDYGYCSDIMKIHIKNHKNPENLMDEISKLLRHKDDEVKICANFFIDLPTYRNVLYNDLTSDDDDDDELALYFGSSSY